MRMHLNALNNGCFLIISKIYSSKYSYIKLKRSIIWAEITSVFHFHFNASSCTKFILNYFDRLCMTFVKQFSRQKRPMTSGLKRVFTERLGQTLIVLEEADGNRLILNNHPYSYA